MNGNLSHPLAGETPVAHHQVGGARGGEQGVGPNPWGNLPTYTLQLLQKLNTILYNMR